MFFRFCAISVIFWFKYHANNSQNPVTGHWREFLQVILEKFNISDNYEIIMSEKTIFGEVFNAENATGLIGHLIRNESDFTLIPISATYQNFPYIDFTLPATVPEWKIVSGAAIGYQKQTYAVLRIFQKEIWLSIVACTILMPLTSLYYSTYWDDLFNAYRAIVNQDIHNQKIDTNRKLWFSWLVATACLSTAFTSCLLAKMTLPDLPITIDTLSDVLKYPDLQLLVTKDTTPETLIRDSSDETMRRVWDQVLRNDGLKTPKQLLANLKRNLDKKIDGTGASIVTEDIFYQICGNFDMYKKAVKYVRVSKDPVNVDLFSFAIRRGLRADVTRDFKDLVLRYTQQCLLERTVRLEQWKGQRLFEDPNKLNGQAKRLKLDNFVFAILVSVFGIGVSVVAFIWENGKRKLALSRDLQSQIKTTIS